MNDKINYLHNKAKALYNKGNNESEIIKELIKEDGVTEFYAETILQNVKADQRDNKDFWKLLSMGLFTVIAGLLINYYSYKIAEQSNSSIFWIYWGIVVAGVLMIIRAFVIFRK